VPETGLLLCPALALLCGPSSVRLDALHQHLEFIFVVPPFEFGHSDLPSTPASNSNIYYSFTIRIPITYTAKIISTITITIIYKEEEEEKAKPPPKNASCACKH
jgi:hypothetical protein